MIFNNRFLKLLSLSLILFLGACHNISDKIPFETKTAKEKEITALKVDFQKKLDESNAKIEAAMKAVIASKDAQIQAVANSFYGISTVFKTVPMPSRADLIAINMNEEGWAAIDHLVPSYDQMMRINERITKELDETKTSLEDLKKSHDEVIAENTKLNDATKQALDKVNELRKEKDAMRQEFADALSSKQQELNEANNKIIATEKQRADNAAARQAQLAKLSWGAGILAALCLAAALFSPVFKQELLIGAGAMGAAAVAIPFVEPYMVLIGFGLIAAGIIIWCLYRFHLTDKSFKALVNANHDVAQSNPEVYKTTIEPAVAAYATKYTKDGSGNITTVPDKSIAKVIDSQLIATDRK